MTTAHDGDTIQIGAGTFQGGVVVDKSVSLVGKGADATIISGGGPVLTIGVGGASAEPTVSISGVTISHGVTHSASTSQLPSGVQAFGGGLYVPSAASDRPGATVTITDSVIDRNSAAPTASYAPNPAAAPGWPLCPTGLCRYGGASGGGIWTWGSMTLTRTVVTDNTVGGKLASDAQGGGIWAGGKGSLTLTESKVRANAAIAQPGTGRYAEGGGIFTEPGEKLTISDSGVSGNTASLTTNLPVTVKGSPIDLSANGGGIHAGDDGSVTVTNSQLEHNLVVVHAPRGQASAFDFALHPGSGPFALAKSTISNNRLVVMAATTQDVGPVGSALGILGPTTVADSAITGNTVTVRSPGAAGGTGGVYSGDLTSRSTVIRNTVISENTVTASSSRGAATILGAGLLNEGAVTLIADRISGNVGRATGTSGFARGGGIWNGMLPLRPRKPAVRLALQGTTVTGNVLRGSPRVRAQGGGLYTAFPFKRAKSAIARNSPDQCWGC